MSNNDDVQIEMKINVVRTGTGMPCSVRNCDNEAVVDDSYASKQTAAQAPIPPWLPERSWTKEDIENAYCDRMWYEIVLCKKHVEEAQSGKLPKAEQEHFDFVMQNCELSERRGNYSITPTIVKKSKAIKSDKHEPNR